MTVGAELVNAIRDTRVPIGRLRFWWLGQQSWAVRTARKTLYLDPYLTPKAKRNTPPLFAPEELVGADLLFGSHDHTDHIDRPSLPGMLAASPAARLLVPRAAAATLPDDGVPADRLVPFDDETVWEDDGVRVTAIKAQHEFFEQTDAHGYPHLQWVIELDGVRIHHAGDTLRYDGMEARLAAWPPCTVSFLPINGRDAERYARGCMGNMTWQEAADLAGALAPAVVCPAHYEMFSDNSQDPAPFVAYLAAKYPDRRAWVGRPGEGMEAP
ncbi:MAG: MBL fold metallo-hydrolase [Planctomycetota bacterium]